MYVCLCNLPEVITCERFQNDILRVNLQFYRGVGEFFIFLLFFFCMDFTTVQRYCTVCNSNPIRYATAVFINPGSTAFSSIE